MLPISKNETVRFVPVKFSDQEKAKAEAVGGDISPFENPPTYLLSVPGPTGRARLDKEMVAQGAYNPHRSAIIKALEDGIREEVSEDQQGELLQIVHEFAALENETDNLELLKQMQEIEGQLRGIAKDYTSLLADRAYYSSLLPVIAAKLLLRGWENIEAPFKLDCGKATDECLSQIPHEHLLEVGFKALALFYLNKDQAKN